VRAIKGTAGDPEMLAALERVEDENARYAMLWRQLMTERSPGPLSDAEALRLTARAAVEDWLEAPL
jgi:hypothetical protein